VWLGLRRSRACSTGHELDDVLSDMTKQANKIIERRDPVGQPAGQALSNMRKGSCAVDLEQRVARRLEHGRYFFADVTITLVERFEAQQRVEVVAKDFGGKVLLMREPAQPRDTFKINAMLDSPKQAHDIMPVDRSHARSRFTTVFIRWRATDLRWSGSIVSTI